MQDKPEQACARYQLVAIPPQVMGISPALGIAEFDVPVENVVAGSHRTFGCKVVCQL